MMQIVTATPGRYPAIADLNHAAFGSDGEGTLIARLRHDGLVLVERVALVAGELVGHILFSRLAVEIDGRGVRSAALARWRSVRTGSAKASAPVWCRTGWQSCDP